MSFLQGNTYLKPIQVFDSNDNIIKADRVTKGEFVFGDLYKYYGEDGDVTWNTQENSFIVPFTEEDTFSLKSGLIDCQVRLLLNDGSVSGSKLEKRNVYETKSKVRLTTGGTGEETGEILRIKLLKEISTGGGGTTEYPYLNNLPQINGITLVGNKTGKDLGLLEEESDPSVPQHVKDITEKDISDWNNKATESYVDTKVAELVNSAPETLNTLGELANAVKENQNLIDAIKVPTKTSDLTNDSGFITIADVPSTDLGNYYNKEQTESYVQNYVNSVVGNINTALESVLGV